MKAIKSLTAVILTAVILCGCTSFSFPYSDIIKTVFQKDQRNVDISSHVEEKSSYCYYALDDGIKEAYLRVCEAVKTHRADYIKVGEYSLSELALIVRAVQLDHPEYYWMPASYLVGQDGSTLYVAFESKEEDHHYIFSKEECETMDILLEERVNEILSAAEAGVSDYDKELIVHDMLCQSIAYVKDDNSCYTSYGALVGGNAVCEGYSRAMQLICNRLNIPCRLVCGESTTEGHMWNLIEIGGKWYHLDLTFDDSDIGLIHGYFNLSDKKALADRTVAPDAKSGDVTEGHNFNISLPVCDSDDFFYYAVNNTVLTDDIDESKNIVFSQLLGAVSVGKASCEFYLATDRSEELTPDFTAKKYALQKCVNSVNYISDKKINAEDFRVAIIGSVFVALFNFEGG